MCQDFEAQNNESDCVLYTRDRTDSNCLEQPKELVIVIRLLKKDYRPSGRGVDPTNSAAKLWQSDHFAPPWVVCSPPEWSPVW